MSDLIERQAAIDALTENKEMINAVLDSLTLDYNTRRNQKQRRGQINEDIETIKALPPAQPEDYHFKPGDGDLISRRSLLRNIIKRLGIKNQDYFTAQESVVVDCIYKEMPVQITECGAEMKGGTND